MTYPHGYEHEEAREDELRKLRGVIDDLFDTQIFATRTSRAADPSEGNSSMTTPNAPPAAAPVDLPDFGPAPTPSRPPAGPRPAAAAPRAAPTSRLAKVMAGRMKEAIRIVFYGPEGIGKTSLALSVPGVILIDAEGGSAQFDAQRYNFRDGDGGHVPHTFQEIIDAIRDLTDSPHDYKALAIDTLDRVETLLWKHVLARDSGKASPRNKGARKLTSIEDYGYGKGFQLALDEWRDFCRRLDELKAKRGMTIILLGHTSVRTFKNPDGDDYDRYQLRVQDRAAGFLKEWADCVGFYSFDDFGGKMDPDDARAKGTTTGRRILKMQRSATLDAKSRIPMPASIEISIGNPWEPFAKALEAGRSSTPDQLRALIKIQTDRLGDDVLTANVNAAVSAATDTSVLNRYLYNLQQREPQAAQAATDDVDGESENDDGF